jgi:flavin-dependent dehydrogenase
MEMNFDVVVIGGGPAGCSTALELARVGYRCMVVERSDYSNVRIGETLPSSIRKLLVDLGAWERFLAADYRPAFAVQSAWGHDQIRERDAIVDPYGSGWHVDRGHFDRTLAGLANASGAQLMQGARVDSIAVTNDGDWRLDIDWSGRPRTAYAQVLVDASGRRSVLARRLGAKRITMDRLIGCVRFFHSSSPEIIEPKVMLVESATDGWWYSAPLPNERLVVAYMTDADLFSKLHGPLMSRLIKLISGAPRTAERLGQFNLEIGPSVSAANSSRLDRVWGKNWIAVGDSAMAFDPLSSLGVYRAIKSGLAAARAIAGFFSKETEGLVAYAADLSTEFDRYMLQRLHYYSMEKRWATKDFWRRRHVRGVTLEAPPALIDCHQERMEWR